MMENRWMEWVEKLQAISQNGLAYSRDAYDLERYRQLQQIVADILHNHTDLAIDKINDFLTEEEGYLTPKIDVRGVVFRDDAMLLVRERSEGKWTLPGGWADVCSSPSENVVREIYEESGYKTRALKLLALYDRSKHPHVPQYPFHVYKLFFLCELIGGSPKESIETDNIAFFRENEIPDLSIRRVTPAQIARMFAFNRNGRLQAEFD